MPDYTGVETLKTCGSILVPGSAWIRGTRWRRWLRHCATSRKVAGSIPDCVIGIFHWYNPSGRTMALGLTQPLTEMNTRNVSWGYRRPVRRADNLTTFMCRLSWKLGASTSWNPQGLSRPVMGLLCCFNVRIRSKVYVQQHSIVSWLTWIQYHRSVFYY